MGDIADMLRDGTLCEGCGVYISGEAKGWPRYCWSCKKEIIKIEGWSEKNLSNKEIVKRLMKKGGFPDNKISEVMNGNNKCLKFLYTYLPNFDFS